MTMRSTALVIVMLGRTLDMMSNHMRARRLPKFSVHPTNRLGPDPWLPVVASDWIVVSRPLDTEPGGSQQDEHENRHHGFILYSKHWAHILISRKV